MIIAEYFFVWIFFKNYSFKKYFFKKNELIGVLKFGVPIFVGLGAAWLLQESDKFIVLKYFDMSIVGIYSFSYLIGRVLQIVNQAIIKTLRPIYYQKLHHGKMTLSYHIKVVALYALVVLILATILAIILVQIKHILLPENYQSGSEVIIVIFYAFAVFGIYQIVSLILEFYKKNIQKMIFFYIAATVNIIFSILLISNFGMLAPAYGTLTGFVILACMSLIYSILILRNHK
jgi:O-antigen/teichoic acid export membrane protein